VTSAAADNTSQRLRAVFGGSVGNLIEWYDWYTYSACAIYFAPLFFPDDDPTTQLLNTAAIFAGSFLIRPLGGWVLGRYADRRGRKAALTLSVMLMCLGSLLIAFAPGYATVGQAAPVTLMLARLLQGFSVGGEYGTSATYMSEVTPASQRGFYSGVLYVTLVMGQLLSLAVLLILQTVFLSHDQLEAWGWRIPFVIGAIAAVVALLLRRTLHETQSAEAKANKEAGSMAGLFKHHTPAFLTVLGYTAGGSLIFYTFTTYMQKYLVNTVHLPIKTASYAMTGALFVYMCMQPVFGALSDRIGRRNNMLLFGGLGALATVPILTALQYTTSPVLAFVLIIAALAIVSFYTSISGIVKAEMFPPEVRALGVGLAYAVANAIFGGSAEYVALGLKSLGHESAFFWYVSGMMVIAFLVSLRLPRQASYLHHDH